MWQAVQRRNQKKKHTYGSQILKEFASGYKIGFSQDGMGEDSQWTSSGQNLFAC